MTERTDEHDVRHALSFLVADEPAPRLGVHDAVQAGRRLRRRHRATRVGVPVAVAAVAAIGVTSAVVVSHGASAPASSAPAVIQVADASRLSTAAHLAGGGDTPVVTSHERVLEAIVRRDSPSGWTFTFAPGGSPAPSLEATADDGAGPGRLELSSTTVRGMLTVHPCTDSEFVAGATCSQTALGNGAFLNVRGLADYQGLQDVIVSITHSDGTGTFVESANYILPRSQVPGSVVTRTEKREYTRVVRSRPHPTYTTAQLEKIVNAVDAAGQGWAPVPDKTG